MNTAVVTAKRQMSQPITNESIRERAEEIQAAWSMTERRRRAQLGKQRRTELLNLILGSKPEPEIWAVASLTGEDLVRVAG